MSTSFLAQVEPDLGFVHDLTTGGADSLNKCYQCATCSTVCPLSSDGNPFPRKEMIWAQWGQTEKLVYNPDVWLCHQCNDCVTYCPRDAKPGDLMAAVRKYSFRHFATPQFMGKALQSVKSLPLLLGFPAILFLIVVLINWGEFQKWTASGKSIVYGKFIPMISIDMIFIPFALFAVIAIILSLNKFWKGLNDFAPPKGKTNGIIGSVISTTLDVAFHRRFQKCDTNKNRTFGHALIFWGFMGLFVTTNIVFAYVYGGKIGLFGGQELAATSTIQNIWSIFIENSNPSTTTPLHPTAAFVKLVIGNGSALIFVIGGIILMFNRMGNKKSKSSNFDWVFMAMIFLTGVTGWLSQWFRLWDIGALAYPTYFIHLVFVFYIIAYFPYSKLAHLAYRFTAMIYSKYSGRNEEIPLGQEQEITEGKKVPSPA